MNHDTALKMKTILKTTIFAAVAAILVLAAVAPSLIGDAAATHYKKKDKKDDKKASQSVSSKQKATIDFGKVKQTNKGVKPAPPACDFGMDMCPPPPSTTPPIEDSANNSANQIQQQSVGANVNGYGNNVQINTNQCQASQQTGDDIKDENIDDRACDVQDNKNNSSTGPKS
jgi:hypothetical protein